MTATIEEVRTHELTQFRWLPMGRSGGRHRAGFVSASGQVHVSLDTRGLTFNEDKTRIVTLDDGFDFLGFTVSRQSDKLLIKTSKAELRRIRERLRTEMRALRGANATAVIARLNPIIRGWAAYYRTVVSSDAFTVLDRYLWRLTYKWAKHGHPNKPRHWIINRYFGAFNKSRRDRWVFGDRDSGAYRIKFAWTGIVRGRTALDHPVPDDAGPGELDAVGAAVAVAEHPPVPPGLVERAEVPVDDPVPRLVRVTVLGPLVGEPPQVAIQRGERVAGHHRPVVGGPAPDDGVEPGDHRGRVGPSQGAHLGA